jgi:hypothetical protein
VQAQHRQLRTVQAQHRQLGQAGPGVVMLQSGVLMAQRGLHQLPSAAPWRVQPPLHAFPQHASSRGQACYSTVPAVLVGTAQAGEEAGGGAGPTHLDIRIV